MSSVRGRRVPLPAFNPSQVPQIAAGEYWLPGVGVSGSSTITWAGQRASGNNLTVGAADLPTAVTGPGGNPAWLFSSPSSQVFTKSSPTGPLATTDGVYAAFWFRYDSLDVAFRTIVEQFGSAGAKKWQICKTASTNVLQITWSDDGTNQIISVKSCLETDFSGQVPVLDKYLFGELLIDPSQGTLATKTRLWFNGFEQEWSGQSGTGGAALFNGGTFRVGNSIFDNQDFLGQIGPIYVGVRVNGVLLPSTENRDRLMRHRSPKDRRLQVVCDGNSLTQGQGNSIPFVTSYPGVLKSSLGALGYPTRDVHDRGQGGLTTQQMVDGFTTRILPFYDGLYARSVLVFFEIRNSFTGLQSAVQIQAQHLAYAARGKAAGFFVIVCTAPGAGGTPAGVSVPGAVNAWIRANWQTFADSFVDLERAPEFSPSGSTLNPTYYSDDVHLTDAGYAVVAARVLAAIIT